VFCLFEGETKVCGGWLVAESDAFVHECGEACVTAIPYEESETALEAFNNWQEHVPPALV
jgi:hypothetical protein